MGEQLFVGTIKGFNPHKGWGFIDCPQTWQALGKDVFLLSAALNGQMVNKGDQVQFQVEHSDRGPQAAKVKVVYKAPASVNRGDYIGTVKSFNPEKGWGFIDCAATHEMYGRDVFLMKTAIQGGWVEKDCRVSFSVVDGQKGPEAQNVKVLGDHNFPSMSGFAMWAPMVAPWTGGKGAGKGMWDGCMPSDGKVYGGVLKSFNADRGFGFITCEALKMMYGQDVFVMKSAMVGTINLGTSVLFTICMGMKGIQAKECWAGAQPEQSFTGIVKMWNEEKGWGFISCKETQSIYGKDIFFHSRDAGGADPTPGQEVLFTVQIGGKDGRPNAVGITFPGA
mmetsp:Transcript_58721/g.108332  ORF Transcript_58721/g.108332 Transcript_58721/m.108332 type:complete len:336 (-) Transcript_58721:125-1132(-)